MNGTCLWIALCLGLLAFWANCDRQHRRVMNGRTMFKRAVSGRTMVKRAVSGRTIVKRVVSGRTMVKRVVNGRTMVRGEWPFLVSLHYLKDFPFTRYTQMEHICGGALIDRKWVITAGHCVGFLYDMKKPENWMVVLGEHNQYLSDLGEERIEPETFYVHPDFRPFQTYNLLNDVALIKLKREATLSSYVGLASLSNDTDTPADTKCMIGGWGQLSTEPYGWGSYIPTKATIFVIDNRTCSDAYSKIAYKTDEIRMAVDETVVCAGVPDVKQSPLQRDEEDINDACNGDSGSPLMCMTGPNGEFQVTGVVSAGKGCGSGKFPGLYTRIPYFYDWIQEVMTNN